MFSSPVVDADLVVLQGAALDAVRVRLEDDARSWAAQLVELQALAVRAEACGPQTRRTLALELAGSFSVGQLTAERWLAEAERLHEALPRTLAMLGTGGLLRHQAVVLLHRTQGCDPELAQAVEVEVLPGGAALCPSDLQRRVDRVRLRLEAEQGVDRHAERIAERRTWSRPVEDGMAVVGALLTAEQGAAYALGLDRLERRERLARPRGRRRPDLRAATGRSARRPARDGPGRVGAGRPLATERRRHRRTLPGDRAGRYRAAVAGRAGPAAVDLHHRPGLHRRSC